MKITACIPAHNDDYTLNLCLASVLPHFDRVVVFDDASTDSTSGVIGWHMAGAEGRLWWVRTEEQLGWIHGRNAILEFIDEKNWPDRHLFWIDADDVLCEYNAGLLREIAAGDAPVVRLQLCEQWGDLNHTTGRLRHYDRCHFYVDRERAGGITWRGGRMAKPVGAETEKGWKAGRSPGPLFFHIKGVKPDRRLVERRLLRRWLRRRNRGEPHAESTAQALQERKGDIHQAALKMILHSRQDKLVSTYLGDMPKSAPQRPEQIEQEIARRQRFEIVYRDGRPVDRIDHGWPPPWVPDTGIAADQPAPHI